ncbi:integrase [Streptomyces anulatus]|nr:integrase [Streptomyces anulatus]
MIKEIIGHAHIGVTAGVYAHVRLRLQRQAIDTLNVFLGQADEDPVDPLATAVVR